MLEISKIIESEITMDKIIEEISEKTKKDLEIYLDLAKKREKGCEDAYRQLQNRMADLKTAGDLITNPEGCTKIVAHCEDYSFLEMK